MYNPKNWKEINTKYKGTDYADDIQAVENKPSLLRKLSKNVRALDTFRKIFNALCANCKAKVIKNPRMSLEFYCSDCRAMAEPKLKKIQERIK